MTKPFRFGVQSFNAESGADWAAKVQRAEALGFSAFHLRLHDWPADEPRPVYYINRVGEGEVLYLNLGHCRGHYDMQPMIEYYPNIERGSWEKPEYYELLRRGIRYCANNC